MNPIKELLVREHFQETLVKLMYSQSLNSISVSKLCKEAGLSRSSFFYYYEGMHQLFEEIEAPFFSHLVFRSDFIDADDYKASLSKMLYFLREKRELFLILHKNDRIYSRFEKLCLEKNRESFDFSFKAYMSMASICSACMTTVILWLKEPERASIEEVTEVLEQLSAVCVGL